MKTKKTLLIVGLFAFSHIFAGTDSYPQPPKPMMSSTEVQQKAGYGSDISYADAGVLELGGSLGFVKANDFSQVSISPSVGWFLTNNFEIIKNKEATKK